MNLYLKIALGYIALISLVAIIITIADKSKAKAHKYRIPEATLLIVSALGGSVAMFITMLIIRHKTKHVKFMLGIPVIMVFQAVLVFWLVKFM